MAKAAAYYRARLLVIRQFIQEELPGNPLYDTGKKNCPLELLKQGYIHHSIKDAIISRINNSFKDDPKGDNRTLSFPELCSLNTWFVMHPEKVAGHEMVTTSQNFPLTIQGTREDIDHVFAHLSGPQNIEKQERIRMARMKAEAKTKLLRLMSLEGTGDTLWITAENALWMARRKDMFPKVKSWYEKGRIANKIYEAEGYPELKLIDVGEGTLLFDFKYSSLSYFYGKHDELRIIRR